MDARTNSSSLSSPQTSYFVVYSRKKPTFTILAGIIFAFVLVCFFHRKGDSIEYMRNCDSNHPSKSVWLYCICTAAHGPDKSFMHLNLHYMGDARLVRSAHRDLEEEALRDCFLSTSPCDLREMAPNDPVIVYPGGKARCIFSNSSEYRFQVMENSFIF